MSPIQPISHLPIDCSLPNLATLDYSDHIIQGANLRKDSEDSCDVVVVGTGAGGASCAYELAKRGLNVVAIEAGGYFPVRHLNQNLLDMMNLLTWKSASEGPKDGSLRMVAGRCVGGGTLLHMLTMTEIPERVLTDWQNRFGLSTLTKEKVDPLVETIKTIMNIQPIPRQAVNKNAEVWIKGCEQLGVEWNLNSRNAGTCIGAGRCYTGCPFGGKVSMDASFIPLAINNGLKLYTDCFADTLEVLPNGNIQVNTSITHRRSGKRMARLKIKARKVVISGGAIQTPALLLRSGMQTSSGNVGARLFAQPGMNLVGKFDFSINGWQGIINPIHIDAWAAPEAGGFFCEPQLLSPSILAECMPGLGEDLHQRMEQFGKMAGGQILLDDDGSGGKVGIGPNGQATVEYALSPRDQKRFRYAMIKISEILFAAGALEVMLAHRQTGAYKSPQDLNHINKLKLNPNDSHLESVHFQGTCPMHVDAKLGVVNEFCQLHTHPDIYLADTSVFPTGVGTNTTLPAATIGMHVGKLI